MLLFSDGTKHLGSETFNSKEDAAVYIYRTDNSSLEYKMYEIQLPEGKVKEVKIPSIHFKD